MLGVGLDALGDGLQVQRARHLDDGLHDGAVVGVGVDVAHEGLVDLERVQREALEVAQRRVAGAEVVQRQPHALRVQRVHHRDGGRRVGGDALGQLELEVLRRQAGVAQRARHDVGQADVAELHGRQVDGHHHRRHAGVDPGLQLRDGGAQHPFADRDDLAAGLGQRDELGRRDEAELGMLPAQQRLDAHELLAVGVQLRLVVQQQLVALQRAAQCRLQLQLARRALLHAGREEAPRRLALVLGAVHRRVGVARQDLVVVAVRRIAGDADRHRHAQLVALHHARLGQALQQLAGHQLGAGGVGAGQQHGELVAAEAGHGVDLAQAALQAARDLAEQRVAHAVAEGVVDVLELVQIHEHQRERPMVAARHARQLADAVGEQAAVGQVGEGVDVRQPHQVALDLAELRDVVEDADVVRHGAVGVALLGDRGPARVEAAVLARGAHLALPVAGGLQRGAHLAAHVAAADAEAQRRGLLALQLVHLVAADVAERLVDGDDAAVAVGDHEALARLLEHGGGQVQLVLDGLALGDVAPLDQQVRRHVARARDRADGQLQRHGDAVQPLDGQLVRDDGAADGLGDGLAQRRRLRRLDAQRDDLVEAAAGDLRMGDAQPVAAGAVHVAHGAVGVEHADELRAVVDQAVGQALALQRAARAHRLREQGRAQAQQRRGDEPEQPQRQGHGRLGAVGRRGGRRHGRGRTGERDRKTERAEGEADGSRARLCAHGASRDA